MNNRQIALKLMLDELGVDPKINTQDDRKRVQKAVYLGQVAGADLGYRFSWYLMGPYSTTLTRDYYELAERLDEDERAAEGKQLKTSLRQPLRNIREILNVPEAFKGGQPEWLELLASYHYLRKVSGKDYRGAQDVLEREKPALAPFAGVALEQLKAFDLL